MAEPVPQFIDALGGPSAVAKVTGHRPGAVSLWKNRRRIPRAVWPILVARLPNVTLDRLFALEAAQAAAACATPSTAEAA